MFGKPEWFKQKQAGWALIPVCRQGWLYLAAILAIVSIPGLLLLWNSLGVESVIWTVASLAATTLDVRAVLRGMPRVEPDEDLLSADERETVSEEIATRNYDFRLRR